MTTNTRHLGSSLQSFSLIASATAILVGCLVLVGWRFDLVTLKSVFPTLAPMSAHTTCAFVLASLSLWLLRRRPHGSLETSGRANVRLDCCPLGPTDAERR